jgi:K+-sensing histidine kinase KdpD
MLRKLRIQLTAWFVFLVLLIYLGDTIAGLFLVDYHLKASIYHDLNRQSDEIAAAVQMADGKPTLKNWAQMEAKLNLKPEATVQLYGNDMKLLERYGLPGVPVLQSGLLRNTVYSRSAKVGNEGYVQVQMPSKQHDEEIHDFEVTKFIRGLYIALAVGVCGWLFSGKAIEPVVRSLRTLRTFVADAGHELRTPLTLIDGSLETLEADLIEHGISTDVLQIMLRASDRLRNLSTNLLLLARMENPELELRKAPLDAREIVDPIVSELRKQADQKKVTLHLTGMPSAAIIGDRDALSRMFTNLIENAIRYTPEGGVITVAGWKQDTHVLVSVDDTGIGIPPDSLANIFDRFYRVDKARSREAGGSGLGLAIVKAIIEAHNGEVTVESRVGKGTKFLISLPLVFAKVKAG